jgi:hypothetical protein
MTIEERFDRLTERHEAMAQTLELWIQLVREAHHSHEEAMRRHDEAIQKTQVLLASVVESIDTLARVAHVHERRISDLERGSS